MANPLVSIVFPCYQMERFVAEGLRSVLSQTYRPLEIVVSENHSRDSTYEILKREIDAYAGPHKVILRQPKAHCDVITHTNDMVAQARGAFVVSAHPDDISLPERVEKMVGAWRTHDVSVIASNAIMTDVTAKKAISYWRDEDTPQDVSLDAFLREGHTAICNMATIGWAREVYETYGPHPLFLETTDVLIPFWGYLMRGCHYISEALVLYRVSGSNGALSVRHGQAPEIDKVVYKERMIWGLVAHSLVMIGQVDDLISSHGPDQGLEELAARLRDQLFRFTKIWTDNRNVIAAQRREWGPAQAPSEEEMAACGSAFDQLARRFAPVWRGEARATAKLSTAHGSDESLTGG